MEDNVSYHFTSVKQRMENRQEIIYQLILRQQPKQSRMCGVGEKADRRPIDPPCVVQVKVFDPTFVGPNENAYLQNPYYFMYASLVAAESDEELYLLRDGKTRTITGSVVSSLYHLKDVNNSDAGFFVFPDLSVRMEGNYRLKLSLYEIVRKDVFHCKSVYSDVFTVYSAKKFPGMMESTFLSRSFADQGLKIRIRKEIRIRRRSAKRKDTESGSDQKGKKVRGDEDQDDEEEFSPSSDARSSYALDNRASFSSSNYGPDFTNPANQRRSMDDNLQYGYIGQPGFSTPEAGGQLPPQQRAPNYGNALMYSSNDNERRGWIDNTATDTNRFYPAASTPYNNPTDRRYTMPGQEFGQYGPQAPLDPKSFSSRPSMEAADMKLPSLTQQTSGPGQSWGQFPGAGLEADHSTQWYRAGNPPGPVYNQQSYYMQNSQDASSQQRPNTEFYNYQQPGRQQVDPFYPAMPQYPGGAAGTGNGVMYSGYQQLPVRSGYPATGTTDYGSGSVSGTQGAPYGAPATTPSQYRPTNLHYAAGLDADPFRPQPQRLNNIQSILGDDRQQQGQLSGASGWLDPNAGNVKDQVQWREGYYPDEQNRR